MDTPQRFNSRTEPWDEGTARKQQAPVQYAAIMERPLNLKKTQARYQYYNKYDDDYGDEEDFAFEAPEPAHKDYQPKPRKLEKRPVLEYQMADFEELGLTQSGIPRVGKQHREYAEDDHQCSESYKHPSYGYGNPRVARKSRPGSTTSSGRGVPLIEPGETIRVLSVTPEIDEPIQRSEAAFLRAEDPLCC